MFNKSKPYVISFMGIKYLNSTIMDLLRDNIEDSKVGYLISNKPSLASYIFFYAKNKGVKKIAKGFKEFYGSAEVIYVISEMNPEFISTYARKTSYEKSDLVDFSLFYKANLDLFEEQTKSKPTQPQPDKLPDFLKQWIERIRNNAPDNIEFNITYENFENSPLSDEDDIFLNLSDEDKLNHVIDKLQENEYELDSLTKVEKKFLSDYNSRNK